MMRFQGNFAIWHTQGDKNFPLQSVFTNFVPIVDKIRDRCGGFVQILDNVSLSGLTIFDFRVKLVDK